MRTALVALFASGCGESTVATPRPDGPGITLESGARGSDTIMAVMPRPLSVVVRDAAGRPAAGVRVRFETDSSRPSMAFPVLPHDFPHQQVAVETSTDSTGRAATFLQLGRVTGKALLHVTVPSLGFAVTDTVTVQPGRRVGIAEADAATYIGGSTQLNIPVVDRMGNAHPDPVTYSGSSDVLDVTPAGRVTGKRFGEGAVTVRSAAYAATIPVGVVPAGTTAVREFVRRMDFYEFAVGIATMNLDLSGYRYLTKVITPCNGCAVPPLAPRWHPGGTRVFYTTGYDSPLSGNPGRLAQVDLAGQVTPLAADRPFDIATDPAPSRDGQSIFFVASGGSFGITPRVGRMLPDGSAAVLLPASVPSTELGHSERRPAPSPNGTLLAYSAGFATPRLRVRNVATGLRTALDVQGGSPRWSPDGTQLAFVVALLASWPGELHVIRPDGSEERRVAPGVYAGVFDWSPDGKYIVAERENYGGLVVIEVASGTVVTLTRGVRFGEPSWKP